MRRRFAELLENPELKPPRIGVVCFNRSLVPFLLARTRDAFGDEFENVKGCLTVSHFERLIRGLPIPYLSFDQASAAERATYYRSQLEDLDHRDPQGHDAVVFDAVFVDEGQDFVPEEHQLLLDLVRSDPNTSEKSLVIFYDNAQNVYARPQPIWSNVGIDVARGDRTRVMKQCFRNTRQILEVAFNVLYGSQARSVVRTRTFLDVDTLRANGLITETAGYVKVHFAEREGAAPIIKSFSSQPEKLEWMADEIRRLVVNEYVRTSDILVLFRLDHGFEAFPDLVTDKLGAENIKGFLRVYRQSHDKDSYLFRENHLTLSTIASAKGYDAPVVFLADMDRFEGTPQDRALFYVGATRAKHFLYLLGVNHRGQETFSMKLVVCRRRSRVQLAKLAQRLGMCPRPIRRSLGKNQSRKAVDLRCTFEDKRICLPFFALARGTERQHVRAGRQTGQIDIDREEDGAAVRDDRRLLAPECLELIAKHLNLVSPLRRSKGQVDLKPHPPAGHGHRRLAFLRRGGARWRIWSKV